MNNIAIGSLFGLVEIEEKEEVKQKIEALRQPKTIDNIETINTCLFRVSLKCIEQRQFV